MALLRAHQSDRDLERVEGGRAFFMPSKIDVWSPPEPIGVGYDALIGAHDRPPGWTPLWPGRRKTDIDHDQAITDTGVGALRLPC